MSIHGPPAVSLVGAKRHKKENHTGINGRDTTSVRSLVNDYNFGICTIAAGPRRVLDAATAT